MRMITKLSFLFLLMIIKNFSIRRKEYLMIVNFSENMNEDNDDYDCDHDECKGLFCFKKMDKDKKLLNLTKII